MIGYLVALFALVLSYVLGFVLGRRSFAPVLPSVPDAWEPVMGYVEPVEGAPTVYISPALYERPDLVDEFRVETMRGTAYKGTSGADARRVVERLRGSGVAGSFFHNDVRRDWWPR